MFSMTLVLENDFVINKIKGKCTIDDIISFSVQSIVDWKNKSVIWDFNSADLSDYRNDSIKNLIFGLTNVLEPLRGSSSAFVARSDANYGTLRVFDQMSSLHDFPMKTRVFRDIESAKFWLKEKIIIDR